MKDSRKFKKLLRSFRFKSRYKYRSIYSLPAEVWRTFDEALLATPTVKYIGLYLNAKATASGGHIMRMKRYNIKGHGFERF